MGRNVIQDGYISYPLLLAGHILTYRCLRYRTYYTLHLHTFLRQPIPLHGAS